MAEKTTIIGLSIGVGILLLIILGILYSVKKSKTIEYLKKQINMDSFIKTKFRTMPLIGMILSILIIASSSVAIQKDGCDSKHYKNFSIFLVSISVLTLLMSLISFFKKDFVLIPEKKMKYLRPFNALNAKKKLKTYETKNYNPSDETKKEILVLAERLKVKLP